MRKDPVRSDAGLDVWGGPRRRWPESVSWGFGKGSGRSVDPGPVPQTIGTMTAVRRPIVVNSSVTHVAGSLCHVVALRGENLPRGVGAAGLPPRRPRRDGRLDDRTRELRAGLDAEAAAVLAWAMADPGAPDGAHIHLDAGIDPLDLGSASLMLARHRWPSTP